MTEKRKMMILWVLLPVSAVSMAAAAALYARWFLMEGEKAAPYIDWEPW